MSEKKIQLIRFGIAAAIYLLVVIWIGNYWLLAGLAIIYDIYVSKKVNWTFWKKRDVRNNSFVEWLDAGIFAVVAVTLINIFLFQNYRIPTGSMKNRFLSAITSLLASWLMAQGCPILRWHSLSRSIRCLSQKGSRGRT